MTPDWPFDEVLRPVKYEMDQQEHCCNDVPANLVLTVHNGGTKSEDAFIAITVTGEWAFNDEEEVDRFAAQLKSAFPHPKTTT